MKHIAAVAALLFACSSLCADSLFTGVHTVYIAGNNLAVKHDITRALRSELPQVRVVSRRAEADVVLEVRDVAPRFMHTNQPTMVTIPRAYIVSASSNGQIQQSVQNRTEVNPEATHPTRAIGSAFGVVHKPNDSTDAIVYEGLPSPFFATQFAARFVEAWRDANR